MKFSPLSTSVPLLMLSMSTLTTSVPFWPMIQSAGQFTLTSIALPSGHPYKNGTRTGDKDRDHHHHKSGGSGFLTATGDGTFPTGGPDGGSAWGMTGGGYTIATTSSEAAGGAAITAAATSTALASGSGTDANATANTVLAATGF